MGGCQRRDRLYRGHRYRRSRRTVYHEGGNTTTLDVTGLIPETAYRYRVAAYSDGNSTIYSNPIEVTTSQPSLGDISITANEATDITGTSFVANWTRHPLATDSC